MLLNNFFKILKIKSIDKNKFEIELKINPEDAIFISHFPDQPVVPGVYSIAIIKEITEKILQKDLVIKTAENIKFFAPIIPQKNEKIKLNLDINHKKNYDIKATLFYEKNIFLKLRAAFD